MINHNLMREIVRNAPQGPLLDFVAKDLNATDCPDFNFTALTQLPSTALCLKWAKTGGWQEAAAVARMSDSPEVLNFISGREKRKSVLGDLLTNSHLSDENFEKLTQRALKSADMFWLLPDLFDYYPQEMVLPNLKKVLEGEVEDSWNIGKVVTAVCRRADEEIFDFLFKRFQEEHAQFRNFSDLAAGSLKSGSQIPFESVLSMLEYAKSINRAVDITHLNPAQKKLMEFFFSASAKDQLRVVELQEKNINYLVLQAKLKNDPAVKVSLGDILCNRSARDSSWTQRALSEAEDLVITKELIPGLMHSLGGNIPTGYEPLKMTQDAIVELLNWRISPQLKGVIVLKSKDVGFKVDFINDNPNTISPSLISGLSSAEILEFLEAGLDTTKEIGRESSWLRPSSPADPAILTYALEAKSYISRWHVEALEDYHIELMLKELKDDPQPEEVSYASRWSEFVSELILQNKIQDQILITLVAAVGGGDALSVWLGNNPAPGELSELFSRLAPRDLEGAKATLQERTKKLCGEPQPWVIEALDLIPQDWEDMGVTVARIVQERLNKEFGSDLRSWETALTLLSSWNGTLPELVQAVKSLT